MLHNCITLKLCSYAEPALLKTFTEMNPSRNVHAHHVFPQKFEKIFLKKGINIHDPKNMTWWEASPHLRAAKSYNAEWYDFFEVNNQATKTQILRHGERLMIEHGIKTYY